MVTKVKQSLASIFFLCTLQVSAQYDTAQVVQVISQLRTLQVKVDTFYNSGLFPTQRTWDGVRVEDNTFSYSATISYVLQQYRHHLPKNTRSMVDLMVQEVNQNAHLYANRKGEASYNFWQTAPPDLPFPNGTKYRKYGNRLPDDLDDSSVIALALGNDSLSGAVRKKIVTYAEANNHKRVTSALKNYQASAAYRTWFADKWVQDFDVSVISNILLFTLSHDFVLTKYDSASMDLIKAVVEADEHFTRPQEVSPYYTSPHKILYHLVRMMPQDSKGYFMDIKARLIQDLYRAMEIEAFEMEKLLVYTSLCRLGERPRIDLDAEALASELEEFYFFSGFGYLPFPPFKSWMIKQFNLVPNMYWISRSFNLMLVLEFLMETGHSFEESEFRQLLGDNS